MENTGMGSEDERCLLSPAVVFLCPHPARRNLAQPGTGNILTKPELSERLGHRSSQRCWASGSDLGTAQGTPQNCLLSAQPEPPCLAVPWRRRGAIPVGASHQ